MRQFMVPFTVAAADVNTLDTTAYVLTTFPSDGLVRVPTRLELKRNAGTAYALTLTGGFRGNRLTAQRFTEDADNYATFYGGGANLVISSSDDFGNVRSFMAIPEEGLLDATSDQTRLVFPIPMGVSLRSGVTSYVLRSTATLSGGTGSLVGRLYFDEYPLGGF